MSQWYQNSTKKILQKDQPVLLYSGIVKSFYEVKQALTSIPVLIYLNFIEPFLLTTNALGVVLFQGPVGKDLCIAYVSRNLY